MAFTDNCDLFASVHEDGANRIIRHLMLQRPSMFNYATADIAGNKELWCEQVEYTQDVTKYSNPIFTVLPPLPVIGVDSPPVGLSFCVQLIKFEVDFHKGNVFALPPELDPLQEQHFAFHFSVCGAIGCPDGGVLDQVPVLPGKGREGGVTLPPVHVRGKLDCFCLDVFVVGHVEHAFLLGRECLLGKVDGVEIVDIKPEELENNIECYIRTAITLTLRQKLAIPLSTFFFSFPLFGMTVNLSPTPNPPIPNNPAVEDDQLKAFITLTT